MSYLTENPEVMIEVLAVLVRRAGGTVTIEGDEAPGPFNLLSKWDGKRLHLVLDEAVTAEEVQQIIEAEKQVGTP